jgi:hypothetical protein
MNRLIAHLSFWLYVALTAVAFGAEPPVVGDPVASIAVLDSDNTPIAPVADPDDPDVMIVKVDQGQQITLSPSKSVYGKDPMSLDWVIKPKIQSTKLPVGLPGVGGEVIATAPLKDISVSVRLSVALGDKVKTCEIRIIVGQGPRPPPKPVVVVGPNVVDPLDTNIKPITSKELKVLIIEDVDKRKDLPLVQLNMLTGEVTRAWLKATCVKDATGTPSFRIVDQKTTLTPEWAAIATEKPKSLPWLFIQNGAAKASVPLPTNFDDLKKIFDKFSGVTP